MRFGFINEGAMKMGTTYQTRYHEIIDEAVYAEEMGFDFFGCSEQHFLNNAGVSSTEVFYGALSQATSRIQIRSMVRLLLAFNHPMRIAEQAATIDILSNGRHGLGTGRANLPYQLDAFEVDADETRAMWEESMQVIVKAFTQETVTHKGHYWNIKDPVHLTPKPMQYPHPPLYVAATSIPTLERAGDMGIGAMTLDHLLGWEQVEKNAKAYKEHIANPSDPISSVINDSLALLVLPAYCGESDKEAKEWGGREALGFAKTLVKHFPVTAARSESYKYFNDVLKFEDRLNDIDYFLETTPCLMVGSPDFFIKQIERVRDMGFDEIILRIDGGNMGHERLMRSIQLIGENVIPHFNNPQNVVRKILYEGGVP